MKVLVFQGFVDPRGRPPEVLLEAWPTLPGLALALSKAGAGVQVVVAARRDALLEREGVPFHFVAEPHRPAPRRLLGHRAAPHPFRALRRARDLGGDVVHLHGLSFPFQARALRAGLPGVPLLAQDHADAPARGWRRPFQRWGLSALDGVAFTARAQAEPFVTAGVLRPDLPVFEVVEGSTSFAPGPRAPARASVGQCGSPAVLWVGDLTLGKDPLTFLEAFALASAHVPEARAALVFRRGALEGEVRARVASDPRLSGRVRLVGPVAPPDMETWLRGADLLASTSHREGSGYTVIEALACGTPVVATDIPSHRKILGEPPAGALFPAGDAGALAARLQACEGLTTDAARGAARDRFEADLSFEAIGRRFLCAYGALLRRPS